MELEGIVRNGVVVPEGDSALPEGARVRLTLVETDAPASSFGQRFARFKGAAGELPADMAEQHEHYRLGTPKR